MKTIKQRHILVSVLLLFATACTQSITKERYIHNFNAWIGSFKKEYKNYKEDDWSRAEAEFKRFSKTEYDRFKADLTSDERHKVDQLIGQYYAVLAKDKANQVKEELNSIMNIGNSILEELQKE